MQLVIKDTYQELCSKMADDLMSITATLSQPLICPASGDTPLGLYRELVRRSRVRLLDVSNWNFVGLDEWVGMNGEDEGSCRQSLNQVFFTPLEIEPQRICFFDGKTLNPEDECRNTELFIDANDGIDVAITGIGMNGHIAMNEPGSLISLGAHVSDIAAETQAVGQKYFKTPRAITKGITLGLANLLEAEHIMLMATGPKKAEIIKKLLSTDEPTADLPASYFLDHPNLTIYLDKEAASLLDTQ